MDWSGPVDDPSAEERIRANLGELAALLRASLADIQDPAPPAPDGRSRAEVGLDYLEEASTGQRPSRQEWLTEAGMAVYAVVTMRDVLPANVVASFEEAALALRMPTHDIFGDVAQPRLGQAIDDLGSVLFGVDRPPLEGPQIAQWSWTPGGPVEIALLYSSPPGAIPAQAVQVETVLHVPPLPASELLGNAAIAHVGMPKGAAETGMMLMRASLLETNVTGSQLTPGAVEALFNRHLSGAPATTEVPADVHVAGVPCHVTVHEAGETSVFALDVDRMRVRVETLRVSPADLNVVRLGERAITTLVAQDLNPLTG